MRSFPGPSTGRRLVRPLVVAGALAAGLAGLPLHPAVAEAGTTATVVGTLVQAWPEHRREEPATLAAEPLSWVRRADGTSVRIPTGDVGDVPAGSTVQVTVGAPVQDTASRRDGYGPARDVLSADVLTSSSTAAGDEAPGPAPTDQVTVVMVTPPGGSADATTAKQLVDTVNGPVQRFWATQSNGAVRLSASAPTEKWIVTADGCSDPMKLWDEAAAAVGFTSGPGRHLLVYISGEGLPGCAYGLGQVGTGLGSGGSLYVRDTLPSLIAHELGHNFGLGHSSERQCPATVDEGACRTAPYRDYYDVMGASWEQLGALTAAQADRLGLLPAAAQQAVTSARGGTYSATLSPLSGSTGTRAVRLTDVAGEVYWLEYRAATGQDAWLGSPSADRFGLQAGVLLHRGGPSPDTSLLLDGTPSAADGWDTDLRMALPVGVPVTVAGGQFTIAVDALDAGSAAIRVVAAPPLVAAGAPAPPAPNPAPRVLPGAGRSGATAAPGPASSSATPAGHVEPGSPGTDRAVASAPARTALHQAAAVRPDGPISVLLAGAALAGGVVLLASATALRARSRRLRPSHPVSPPVRPAG